MNVGLKRLRLMAGAPSGVQKGSHRENKEGCMCFAETYACYNRRSTSDQPYIFSVAERTVNLLDYH